VATARWKLHALLDTVTNDTLPLSEKSSSNRSVCTISMTRLRLSLIREDALMLFDLREEELLSDLHITKQVVLYKYGNHSERFLD